MEDVHLGGEVKVDPNNPAVRRAIESSVRIYSSSAGPNKALSESGHLVNLDSAQMKSLGLNPQDQVVLTDAHGVEQAHGEIVVQGSNDQWYAARLIKLDDIRDLAYLKVDNLAPGTLPHVDIAQSDNTTAGNTAFSVGHAGEDGAITVNGCTITGSTSKSAEFKRLGVAAGVGDQYINRIQSIMNTLSPADKADATIDLNRPLKQTVGENVKGYSGGGLFNSSGELIAVLEATEHDKNPQLNRDTYTPLRQIQAFEAESQKFNFSYGLQKDQYQLFDKPVPSLMSVSRVNGDKRPPFNVATLVEDKY